MIKSINSLYTCYWKSNQILFSFHNLGPPACIIHLSTDFIPVEETRKKELYKKTHLTPTVGKKSKFSGIIYIYVGYKSSSPAGKWHDSMINITLHNNLVYINCVISSCFEKFNLVTLVLYKKNVTVLLVRKCWSFYLLDGKAKLTNIIRTHCL